MYTISIICTSLYVSTYAVSLNNLIINVHLTIFLIYLSTSINGINRFFYFYMSISLLISNNCVGGVKILCYV